MTGIILLALGIMLLIIEAFAPSLGLLGLAGIITFFVGSHYIVESGGLFGFPLGWDFFIALGIVASIPMFITAYLFAKTRKLKNVTGVEGMIGEKATVEWWHEKTGSVQIQGESWKAKSAHDHHFAYGDIVIISDVDGNSVTIKTHN